uniref:galactose-specific lectin nattectin-like n=1 Tax=Semicossyphus pulcher TaxID=241346 RepID=UPI0037E9C5DB
MASSFQVTFFLGLTCGLFIAGTVSQQDDTNQPAPTCAPGWTQFGSRCFIFFGEAKMWIDAEQACNDIGGNLASLHSAAENDFLRDHTTRVSNNIHKHTWIGGHDAVQEGRWMWSDGTTFKYERWGTGEPNNHLGEDCVEMNFRVSYWNDLPCHHQRPFVCAKDV